MPVTALVLVDAVPGMKDAVFRSLDKLVGKGIVAKERIQADNFDVLVKVQAADDDKVDDFIATHLRLVSGVGNLRRVKDPAAEHPAVRAAALKMR
jgi:DNA-binding MarR family transcriptional regulator